jgi:hypothetical protein
MNVFLLFIICFFVNSFFKIDSIIKVIIDEISISSIINSSQINIVNRFISNPIAHF